MSYSDDVVWQLLKEDNDRSMQNADANGRSRLVANDFRYDKREDLWWTTDSEGRELFAAGSVDGPDEKRLTLIDLTLDNLTELFSLTIDYLYQFLKYNHAWEIGSIIAPRRLYGANMEQNNLIVIGLYSSIDQTGRYLVSYTVKYSNDRTHYQPVEFSRIQG